MKIQLSLKLAAAALTLGFLAGCESSGDHGSTYVHGSMYYGASFYDPWYYGPAYFPPTVIVAPPPVRPSHPISIPSGPRVSPRMR